MDFGNVLTAMVTPFNKNNQIDFEVTTNLIEHLLANGTDGIVVSGTTGESPTLTEEEKISLFKHVVKVVDKRVPVIAGTGNNDTMASIALTKKAESCGVDGIMLVTPYYNKPSQKGLYRHFSAIARETNLPIMLYNIPGRSAVNMTPETTISLSEIKNIVSIKEASGDFDAISKIIEKTPDNFTVYSGDDGSTLPILSIGGHGVVSVSSHIIGNRMNQIITAYKDGDVQKATSIHQDILPVVKSLFKAPSPAPIKAALRTKGFNVGSVRLPLVDLDADEMNKLLKVLGE